LAAEAVFDMSKLLIENVDDELVLKLRSQAIEHGVSVEEEHLSILAKALKYEPQASAAGARRHSLADFLLNGGDPWPEDFLPVRSSDTGERRQVNFA